MTVRPGRQLRNHSPALALATPTSGTSNSTACS